MENTNRNYQRIQRAKRSRTKMVGTGTRPRLVVFKSLKNIELQLVDDTKNKTLFGISTRTQKTRSSADDIKYLVDKLSQYAHKNIITSLIFDRSGYAFSGSVKEIADSLTKKGIKI